MVDKCAICGKNVNTHKDRYYKLSGGRDGIACSIKCYNAYLEKKKSNHPPTTAPTK